VKNNCKYKKERVNFPFKSTSPCSRNCAPLYDVERSHLPINLKSLEAGGGGGNHGVGVCFRCAAIIAVGCVVHEVTVG
jgi:hypothetical protein